MTEQNELGFANNRQNVIRSMSKDLKQQQAGELGIIEVPEWGAKFKINRVESFSIKSETDSLMSQGKNIEAMTKMIKLRLLGEDGKQFFKDGDEDFLAKASEDTIEKIVQKIADFRAKAKNSVKDEIDEFVKNS